MSYQRWTEGDAYVIGADGKDGTPEFWCVSCSWHRTYWDILTHLRTRHTNSDVAIRRLEREMTQRGADATWGPE